MSAAQQDMKNGNYCLGLYQKDEKNKFVLNKLLLVVAGEVVDSVEVLSEVVVITWSTHCIVMEIDMYAKKIYVIKGFFYGKKLFLDMEEFINCQRY